MASTSSAGRIRFAVIGVNHGHIYGMTETIRHAGGELVMFHAEEPDLASDFARRYPSVQRVADERAILEDASIHLVLSAIIPHARAPLGIRVMRHGKDFMVDKPGSPRYARVPCTRHGPALPMQPRSAQKFGDGRTLPRKWQ